MKTLLRFICSFACLAAFVFAADPAGEVQPPPAQFRTVDVFVDSKGKPLAAYQLEFTASKGTIRIVGIEGGDAEVFREPPHYDPKAMQGERVILAAFSTAPSTGLPTGRTRVASIHIQVLGDPAPEYQLKLDVAATEGGRRVTVEAKAEERQRE